MNLKTKADDRIGLRAVAHGFSRGKRGPFQSSKPALAGDRKGQRVRSALSPAEAGLEEFGGPGVPRLKPWATALAPSARGLLAAPPPRSLAKPALSGAEGLGMT